MRHRNFTHRSKALTLLCFCCGSLHLQGQSTAVSSVAPPSTIYDFAPLGGTPQVDEPEPWVDWLPVWGQAAREKGFDLPLPMGLGLTYTYMDQNMVVSDINIEGHPLDVTIRDAATTTQTGVFRLDTWVFPFLNVYGLVGQTSGVTKPAVVLPNGEVIGSDVEYNRFSYGAGMTLAGGYKAFFVTLDANYTTGDIVSTKNGQVGDDPIESLTFAPRLGILMSSGRFGTGSLWVGGMCLLATSEIHDVIDLRDRPQLAKLVGEDELHFSVRVKPKDPWNLLIGGNWEINKRWSLTAEVGGIMDRFHAIGAVMWRF